MDIQGEPDDCAPPAGGAPDLGSVHMVQFYESDAFLLDTAARFLGASLGAGDVAVVLATAAHRDGLADRLPRHGADPVAARADGRYLELDADAMLATLMVDGQPDAARFADLVERPIAAAAARYPHRRTRAFGELVTLLCAEGRPEAALRIEELWSRFADRLPLSLLCAYPLSLFPGAAQGRTFVDVCARHSHVLPTERYVLLPSANDQLREVAVLQQRSRALDEETRLRARAQAEATSRAKDEVLAMLAHELRNPLAAVRNAVVSARLDDRHRERALEIAGRQTDQLTRLVDDLLDVARITQRRITLRTQPLSLAEVIVRAVETTRARIEDRGLVLSVSFPTEPMWITGDPIRLEQVIGNLLDNAARYTERGGRVEVIAERDGPDAVVRVRDTGSGIAPDVLPRVFDLFTQGEQSLDRPQGGLGIGLTVVRTLVELHGGRVEAGSEGHGRGTEIVVRLPALPPGAEEPAVPQRSEARSGGRARVLLVEDNPEVAESLTMLLGLLGHRVRIARDGMRALELATTDVPDLMLVDIGLPGMDGYEVARRVRRDSTLARVVLVALTGYGREEDRRHALEAGFDQHLVKPVDAEILEGLVGRLGTGDGAGATPPTLS